MSRRHTINHKTPTSDYPEHLNPFRDEEENEDQDNYVNNKFNTVGRRNSRLSASFRMRSWSMFSSKNSKSTDQNTVESDPLSPKSSKAKFGTLTPKLSHRILEALSPKKNKNKVILTPIPQYVRTEKSATAFKITPKSSRETIRTTVTENEESTGRTNTEINNEILEEKIFQTVNYEDTSNESDKSIQIRTELTTQERDSSNTDVSTLPRLVIEENDHPQEKYETQPKAELRLNQPPVPLPRTIVPVVVKSRVNTVEDCQPSTSEASRRLLNNPIEVKYIQQGAKPKKKRQAPLPPTFAASTSLKQIDPTESDRSSSPSVSVNSSTPEPSLPDLETQPPTVLAQDEAIL